MTKSDKKLRGNIVGCGYFAQFHIEAWSHISEVEILASEYRN